MLEIIGLVAPLFALILLGYVCGKIVAIPLQGLAWLNFFVIYIALPPLFFQLLSKTPVSEFANIEFLLLASGATLVVFVLGFAITRIFKRGDTRIATIQGLAGAYGNIGYMGPPLAIAAFGPEAGVPVALVFCLDNTLHFILAPLLMTLGDSKRKQWIVVFAKILKNIFTHPFIIATIVGLLAAYFQLQIAEPVDRFLDSLAGAAAPCALFSLGVSAALRPLKRVPLDLSYLLPIKLLVHPVLVYFAVSWIPGVDPIWVYAAVLLASLPTATNVFVIAQQYEVWEQRASSAVVLSTVGLPTLSTSKLMLQILKQLKPFLVLAIGYTSWINTIGSFRN